jgi:hypothetical protein
LLQPHYKDVETSAFSVCEDLSDTSEEEDEDFVGKLHSLQLSAGRDGGIPKTIPMCVLKKFVENPQLV